MLTTSTRCATARIWSRANDPSLLRSFFRAAFANARRLSGVIVGPIFSMCDAARSASPRA
ncbi:MAG: hypothetical protein RQ833_05960 [Sphingomonadaceae bacterium]|nr:hypothetical protein [Sphingomonadaceae bacterium]